MLTQITPDQNNQDINDAGSIDLYVINTNKYDLNYGHIISLARGQTRVVRIAGFANHPVCELIAKGQASIGFKPYVNVSEVRRIGMAFYETELKPELIEQYFRIAKTNQDALRKACEPVGSPLDTLQCLLDEIWPHGAGLQTLFGRKMFVGLSRMVEPDTSFLAHHDIFADDAPGVPEATSLKAQFAANIYFQVPDVGGELLIWHRPMSSPEFNRRRKGRYGIPIDELPPPDLPVKPGQGDLLIFDSQKIHAVASPKGSPRTAVSFFIGYRGDDQPLTYWS